VTTQASRDAFPATSMHLDSKKASLPPDDADPSTLRTTGLGTWQLDVRPIAQFGPPALTQIPQYPSLPMEKNYWRVKHTDVPGVYLREIGKSRVVYFPWDIDRVFWEVMCDDHGTLLRNAVDWAANEERPVTVTGPGILDVTVWRQKDSMTVHLVNLTNPMMMRPGFREMIPTPAQRVRVKVPAGRKATKVQLLVAARTPAVERAGATHACHAGSSDAGFCDVVAAAAMTSGASSNAAPRAGRPSRMRTASVAPPERLPSLIVTFAVEPGA